MVPSHNFRTRVVEFNDILWKVNPPDTCSACLQPEAKAGFVFFQCKASQNLRSNVYVRNDCPACTTVHDGGNVYAEPPFFRRGMTRILHQEGVNFARKHITQPLCDSGSFSCIRASGTFTNFDIVCPDGIGGIWQVVGDCELTPRAIDPEDSASGIDEGDVVGKSLQKRASCESASSSFGGNSREKRLGEFAWPDAWCGVASDC
jgi:hypothetical protein